MNCSLLIVEDDPDQLDRLARRFSRIGYQVTAAHHPRQALAAAMLHPFQVAIVKHTLPEIDGISLTSRLHALRQNVQVIVLTSESDAVSKARAAGALACLIKPCKQAVLEATVEDLVESCVDETRLHAKPAVPILKEI
jgi:two-component system chemotaxis response regulator CheY